MNNQKIKILMIEPMKPPKVYFVKPTMKKLGDLVDVTAIRHGGMEAKRLEKGVYALFNKDRFLSNLPPNRKICDDILCGTIVVLGGNEDYVPVSLTDEQVLKYALRFANAETFDDIDVTEANLNLFYARLSKEE